MSKIEAVSPTRIDLAGGTLDCWPLYALVGGSRTINFGIDIVTTASLTPRSDQRVHINCADLDYIKSFENLGALLDSEDKELTIIKPQLKYWHPTQGFELELSSESPVGGGLGGSSSLTISMIKVFKEWLNRDLEEIEMVALARDIETSILGKPAGTQDYIPAIRGGLCDISYAVGSLSWSTSHEALNFFNESSFLVYTGEPHHSGLNNWDIIKGAVEGDASVLRALHEISKVSFEMVEVLKNINMPDLTSLFSREYEARKQLSESYITPGIEKLKALCLAEGASSFKVCGAGGGGCVLVVMEPQERGHLQRVLEDQSYKVIDYKVWRP